MKKLYFGISVLLFVNPLVIFSQLTVSIGTPVNTLVQNVLVGPGVTITNVTYSGHPNAIGHFQTGLNPTNLGLTEGIIMSTGIVNSSPPIGSPVIGFVSNANNTPGDALLGSLVSGTTYDAAILEFDFVPLSDTIKFRYVFASEEYPEFVGSSYNDVFGFFISGLNPLGGFYTNYNIARIPGTTLPVSINNVNSGSYSQYYINNQGMSGQTIVFDGFTTVLTAWAVVIPCVNYHLKIAIADVGDGVYDSAVFLEANSFSSPAVEVDYVTSIPAAGNDCIEGCSNAIITFSLPNPVPVNRVIPFQISGTALNGIDYQLIPNSVTIPAGQSSTTLTIIPIYDGIAEPTETVILAIQTSACTSTTLTINILDYTMVSATASGSTTICTGTGPVNIGVTASDGTPPYTYTWSHGLGGNSYHSVNPAVTTTYTVTVTDLCGNNVIDSVTVTIAPDAIIEITPNDPSVCFGQNTTLIADGGDTYVWNTGHNDIVLVVSPIVTTTYSVTGTDALGCTGTANVTVSVNPNLVVSVSPTSSEICDGNAVQLTTTSTGTNLIYNWSNGQSDAIITVSPSITTLYVVDVTDNHGCTGSADAVILVNPVPHVEFEAITREGCAPFVVNFLNLSDPGNVLWHFGEGNTSTFQNPANSYTHSGYFTVKLSVTAAGCENSLTKADFIHIYPKVIAGFVPSDNIVFEDESLVQFFDVSTGATNWLWNFGTNSNIDVSDLQNPEFTFPKIGDYIVWQYVQNQWGCRDSISKTIIVKPLIAFYFPNAFTPNGDGINEVFMPFGNGYQPDNYEFVIYDRWGKQVFRTTSMNIPWDGKLNGKVLRSDVYVYFLRASFDGVTREFQGFVTLIE
jgi:gliding motility-associated-like protein